MADNNETENDLRIPQEVELVDGFIVLSPPRPGSSLEGCYRHSIANDKSGTSRMGNAVKVVDYLLGHQRPSRISRSADRIIGGYQIDLFGTGHRYHPPREHIDRLRVPLAKAIVDVGSLFGIAVEVEVCPADPDGESETFGLDGMSYTPELANRLLRSAPLPTQLYRISNGDHGAIVKNGPPFSLKIETEVYNPIEGGVSGVESVEHVISYSTPKHGLFSHLSSR